MGKEPDKVEAVELDDVLKWERDNVHRAPRRPRADTKGLVAPMETKEEAGPSALCLSGGGIRSASIALGFLQACDRHELLKKFDYLLTVSGGGYIGGWLTALIFRIRQGQSQGLIAKTTDSRIGIDEDHGALIPDGLGAKAVANLRRYSNYLTPRLGLFSGDSLALAAVFLRNLFLNGLILVPLLGAAILVPKIICAVFSWKPLWNNYLVLAGSAFFAIVSGAYTVYAASASVQVKQWAEKTARKATGETAEKTAKKTVEKPPWNPLSPDGFALLKVAPLVISLLMLSAFSYAKLDANPSELVRLAWLGLIGGAVCALGLFLWGFIKRVWLPEWEVKTREKIICNSAQVAGAYFIGATAFFQIPTFWNSPLFFLVCVPPGLLLIYLLGVALFAGFVNPVFSDDDREWWARAAGYLLFTALLWVAVGVIGLCAEIIHDAFGRWPEDIAGAIPSTGWIPWSTLGSGVLALLTRDSNVVSAGQSKGVWKTISSILFAIACPVFILTLLLSLSIGEGVLGRKDGSEPSLVIYLVLFVGLCLVVAMLSCVVDVNKFSLHNTYRNRLIRTFLGASNENRKPHPFTGFDEKDNIFLAQIDEKQRPYHVVCGSVNLYAGANLAWQERRAALFTFSSKYCGSDFLDYRETKDYGGPNGLTLGTAIAVSGAAANPNMGFYTKPDRAFVMTLFNVRLGWWLGNPKFPEKWLREGPFPALWPLICELLLLTRETSPFVNVSDGGHFDDTAVYEAVRRRCSTIFLVDANSTHENVARMIRKVRIDFGVDITQTDDLSAKGVPARIYKIEYPATMTQRGYDGTLVRVYPALEPLEANLPADVADFHKQDPSFPADTLLNQWYGEAQFESYRKLGRQIGMLLFGLTEVEGALASLKRGAEG